MAKKKILIVDDEEALTRLVKLNLEATGNYEVMTENKGSQGLAAVKAFKPDLVLLDIIMPDMDGSDVAAKIMEDRAVSDTPVVFLTAMIRKEETAANRGVIGGHPFIAKSVSIKELIDCIEKNVRRY
jgi:DNA-binding response OmpR family regulator